MQVGQSHSGFLGFGNKRDPRWDEGITWLEIPGGQWTHLRLFGPIYLIAQSWITTKTKKKFPVLCAAYDSTTRQFVPGKCPIVDEFDPFNSENPVIKAIAPRETALAFAIDRNLQAYKTQDPRVVPWRPIRLSVMMLIALERLSQSNTFRASDGKTYGPFDLNHEEYGADIQIYYDPNAKIASAKYQINKLNITPLTEEEKGYFKDLYDWPTLIKYPARESVKKSLMMNGYYQELQALKNYQSSGFTMGSALPQPPAPPSAFGQPATQQAYGQPPAQGNNPFGGVTPMVNPMTAPAVYPMTAPVAPQSAPNEFPNPGFGNPPVQNFSTPSFVGVPQAPQQTISPPAPSMVTSVHQQGVASMPPPSAAQSPKMAIQQFHSGVGNLPVPPINAPMNTMPPPPTPGSEALSFSGSPWPSTATPPPMGATSAAQAIAVPPPPSLSVVPPQNTSSSEGDIQIPFEARVERTFKATGRPIPVKEKEFQELIAAFSQKLTRGVPLKKCTSGNLENLEVLACFSSYVGDTSCVQCVLRSECLNAFHM